MKKLKIFTSALLTLIILFSCTALNASANEGEEKMLSMLCYNVAGLPDFNKLLGKADGVDVKDNQAQLGAIFNNSDYDIIAVQEDFSYHSSLVAPMANFPYKTIHTGGIPAGDGMNVFSRTPIYNETRTQWNKAFGIIDHGADEMTPKGILYTLLDLGDGVFIDLYNIHADAFGDEGSCAARRDNFKQLAEMINNKNSNRPVIVTGDFNSSSHFSNDDGLTEYLMNGCGFKDAWTQLYNDGDYQDYTKHYGENNEHVNNYWGRWDSVEKFLYKSGGGVELEATDFEYIFMKSSSGGNLSDHAAASAKFKYEKTDDFVENEEELNVVEKNSFKAFFKVISCLFKDLYKIFSNIGELISYIK